jgi:UDPglucose--hexose-1-phosphate uridylyltransferase
MSEYRFDPFNGIWVAIATIRGQRPHEFQQLESRVPDAVCPFCRGHETETPPAVLELTPQDLPDGIRAGAVDDWLVRVVPNKYPALTPIDHEHRASHPPYRQKLVGGHQEIIIESPRHVASLSELRREEMYLTLRAMQQRIRYAQTDPAIEHVSAFKNCRPEAGASLEHAHSQLVFSRFAAEAVVARWQRCQDEWQRRQVGLVASIRDAELDSGARVLDAENSFVSFCPFASRFAYQIWIVPQESSPPFEDASTEILLRLSDHLRAAISRLEGVHPSAPYNVLLHLSPLRSGSVWEPAAHLWFVEVVPRLGRFAGYELMGAGWINEAPPELAAAQLREVELAETTWK